MLELAPCMSVPTSLYTDLLIGWIEIDITPLIPKDRPVEPRFVSYTAVCHTQMNYQDSSEYS